MFELTINNTVYEFNFGMGFMRELDPTVTKPIDGIKGKVQNLGVQYAIAGIIDGDVEAYNECMGVGVPDEDGFTQQQIYDIKITKKGQSSQYTKDGKLYNQYEFILEYKIQENNGTFRRDMGSDVSKPQYFVIADMSGEMCVENILNYKVSN